MRSVFNDAYAMLFSVFFIELCCGYSFELPRLVEAIQMSTHNICLFHKEVHVHVDKSTLVVIF